MVKHLLLCRHADAGPAPNGLTDFERTLTETGMQQASQAGRWLLDNRIIPEWVLASPANRAEATARLIVSAWPGIKVNTDPELYEAATRTALALINRFPEQAGIAMLVGHNPTISHLAGYLTDMAPNLLTCQMLLLKLESKAWAEVSAGTATVIREFLPEV